MSTRAIDYNIVLKRDGQTQQQRMPQWLDPDLIAIDDRTKEDFLVYIQSISSDINFYDLGEFGNLIINGDWAQFFNLSPAEIAAESAQASLTPHLALWDAFQELYRYPQALMNTLTKRHLDFYYKEVLKFPKNKAIADTAHAIFELKKNSNPVLLKQGTLLQAGKDSLKKTLYYKIADDIIVNQAKVVALKSVYVNPQNRNFIHQAPIANSADGLGAELNKNNPKWPAFGSATQPLAHIGFCLAADVLKMKEGDRTVNVKLTVRNLSENAKNSALTNNLFQISITGEKGWIGPKVATVNVSSADNINFNLNFSFQITADEPAVSNYNAQVHGGVLDTNHPVLQVLINNEKADFGYRDLASAELLDSQLEVVVKGIKDLQLENDSGTINAKKPFSPFGATPETNANFSLACDEAFSKRLKNFSLDVIWKNIPDSSLGDYFKAYGSGNSNADFTATAAFKDAYGWVVKSQSLNLFNTSNAQAATTWEFNNGSAPAVFQPFRIPSLQIKPQLIFNQSLEQKISGNMAQLLPAFSSLQIKATAKSHALSSAYILYKPLWLSILGSYQDIRKGVLSIRLKHDFLFKPYKDLYTAEVLRHARKGGDLNLPSEPFAPEIQSASFNYTATTAKVSFNGTNLQDFINEEIEFFQYGAFGTMREHAYARSQQLFLKNNLVKLLPEYNAEGEFYIGLSDLDAGDSSSILFQVAEGSANPEQASANISWSVLCDNYWKQLGNDDLIFDTTNGFLNNGIIKFVIPPEVTNKSSIMPNGLVWLKASIAKNTDAVCNLIDVKANAAICIFQDQDNDPAHFANALPANTINKLNRSEPAIKGITQPYASFGGRGYESDSGYYIRVSERLRHKQRNVTLWDYERMILQQFPNIQKVKCINHANGQSFYAPGHIMVVVVPDLTNKNAVDPLRPKVDKNTLVQVKDFLSQHSSTWVEFHVSNPTYETVKISAKVKLKKGYEFNYYEKVIDQALQAFLSPWITNPENDLHFGGKVTTSMIVNFLEKLEYVDYLSDLFLYQQSASQTKLSRLMQRPADMVEASNPAAILVSASQHDIYSI